MIAFEIGKKYYSRFIGDADLSVIYLVTKRTAKFITVADEFGNTARFGLNKYFLAEGKEVISKDGEFISAEHVVA